MKKVMCGLWHVHVEKSEHNDNGKCNCIGCFGGHCHKCSTYGKLADAAAMLSIMDKTRCQLCQAYQEKTK